MNAQEMIKNAITQLAKNMELFVDNFDAEKVLSLLQKEKKSVFKSKYESLGYFSQIMTDLMVYVVDTYPKISYKILANFFTDQLFSIQENLLFLPKKNLKHIYNRMSYIKDQYPHFFEEIKCFFSSPYQEVFFPYQIRDLGLEDITKDIILSTDSQSFSGTIRVIIPFYVSDIHKFTNRFSYLLDTVYTLQQQIDVKYKLIIFCNQSTSELAQDVYEKTHADYVLFSKENIGSAAAKNQSWSHIKNKCQKDDFVLFLDDDIYFTEENTLSILSSQLYNYNEISCVSPIIIHDNPSNKMLLVRGYEPLWEFSLTKDVSPLYSIVFSKFDNIKDLLPAYLLEGCCLMMRCEYFFSGFKFPEEYNYYYEETLLENQIYLKTNKICAVSQSVMITHRKAGGGAMSSHTIYYFYRNLIYYIHDLGIDINSSLGLKIIERHLQYINYLISLESDPEKQKTMTQRLDLAKNDSEKFLYSKKKMSHNKEYNIYGSIEVIGN